MKTKSWKQMFDCHFNQQSAVMDHLKLLDPMQPPEWRAAKLGLNFPLQCNTPIEKELQSSCHVTYGYFKEVTNPKESIKPSIQIIQVQVGLQSLDSKIQHEAFVKTTLIQQSEWAGR